VVIPSNPPDAATGSAIDNPVPPIAAHPTSTPARAAKPAVVTPSAKPIKKPARKTDNGSGSGSASEDKDLLEKDI
jgi:hypothetical protein